PDSTASSRDKQNVRDGHYTLWSPTVYITKVDNGGKPSDPTVQYVIDLVLGATEAPDAGAPDGGATFDGRADVIKVGLIPECAMRVTRSEDGGDLRPFAPPSPCSCYYASKVSGSAPAGCTACTQSSECGAATCSHGFCESSAVLTSASDAGTD